MRRLLSEHRPAPPGGWRFLLNPYGRPELPDPGDPPLRFSLSHCRGCVAAACVAGREIGVDVERVDRECDFAGIARSSFAPEESDVVQASEGAARRRVFFEYWTLKEAYIKARGMGLSLPLAEFSFTFDPPRIRFGARLADDSERWRFWQADPVPGCRLAAAATCEGGEEIEFRGAAVSWDQLLDGGRLE